MKVYFSANHRYLERDLGLYREILSAIRCEGHVLVNSWVEAVKYKWPEQKEYYDWATVCIESKIGLDDADMLVVEASGESGFGVGFEVAYGLSVGKKIMILLQSDKVNDSYASGLERHSGLSIHEYDRNKAEPEVRKLMCSIEKF